MAGTMLPAKEKIRRRIRNWGPGRAFTPKDFIDLASRGTIDMTLSALTSAGAIRRIARGVYDTPRTSKVLGGELSPDIDNLARAIARRFRWQIVPAGALAANMLGLSTQVPARIIYLTDGPTRTIELGRQSIQFKHARPKHVKVESPRSGMVIQALRHLGKDRVTAKVIQQLRARLKPVDRRRLREDARLSSDWIYAVAQKVAENARRAR